MKEEEQQIALWNWLGWRFPCPSCYNNGYKDRWRTPDDQGCRSTDELQDTLDTNSLDVLHEMEKKLWNEDAIQQKFNDYVDQLCKVVNCFDTAHLVHATAKQKRKAMLLALNLWREDSK